MSTEEEGEPRSVRLRRLARQIRNSAKATVADAVRLGVLLAEAKAVVGTGAFMAWYDPGLLGLSYTRARAAMLAAKRLENVHDLPLERISIGALDLLIREEVLADDRIREAIAVAAQNGPISFSEVRDVASSVSLSTIYPAPAETLTWQHLIGERVIRILDQPGDVGLYLSSHRSSRDPEDADAPPTIRVQLMTDKATASGAADSLKGALDVVQGCEPMLECPSPMHIGPRLIPLARFSKSSRRCKVCERARSATNRELARQAKRDRAKAGSTA